MTHIENIPHILENGITHSKSLNANLNFVPIGDSSLISKRSEFLLDNGRKLGEYIPFYFGVRTPMLYVVQKGFNMVASIPPEKIIYCVSSVQKIIDLKLDFVFTDGHAVDRLSMQYAINDIQNIDTIIDKNSIVSKYWIDENDLDRKRKKEAEFLVLGDIAQSAILGYISYNEKAKNSLIDFGIDTASVYSKSQYYF